MLRKTIPLYLLLAVAAVEAPAIWYLASRSVSRQTDADSDPNLLICKDNKVRLNGYKYIKPLLFTESECESPEMMGVKAQLQDLINEYKKDGKIQDASVYLRKLNQGEWMEINPADKYLPGSLMKVPELITFIRMSHRQPGLLDRKVTFERPFITGKDVHYTSKSIEVGKSYTIRELLNYMIVYSDNNATALLNTMMDIDIFKKVFTDLGIPAPDLTARDIPITASHFSRFMRAIFNASYLTIDESEFCAELLVNSQFASGIRSAVPSGIPMAHKFGEAGNADASYFSESAIIYYDSSPYLITIMTRGKDLSLLPEVVKGIGAKSHQLVAG